MAVLALLLAMVSQLISSTSAVTNNGKKRMDADSQARLLLDRMALDFGQIVKRADVDFYFEKHAGNDQMAFFSEAAGYYPSGVSGPTPKSGASLIGYRVNDNFQLERLSKSLVWSGVNGSTPGAGGVTGSDLPMAFLPNTITGSWGHGIEDGTDPDYHVIADQVYRLEYQFLLKPYTDAAGTVHPAVLSLTPWDTRQAAHSTANGLSDVSAIVVTMAILDNTSRKIVPDGSDQGLVAALPDAEAGTSILQTWNGSGYLKTSGIPPAAAAQIRIYQRYFYLNNKKDSL